jgi:ABC-type enterochelin transport system permease subunit
VICFFELLTPSIMGNYNFFNFISFLMIFGVPIGGVQVLLRHQNQGAIRLDLVNLECLSVWSPASLP